MDCKDSYTGIKVALLVLLITFLYLFCVTFFPMTEDGAEQAKTITPFLLGTVIGTLIGFYYGNKHEQQKALPPITPIDQAAIDAAKVEAAKVVEETKEVKLKEEKDAKV